MTQNANLNCLVAILSMFIFFSSLMLVYADSNAPDYYQIRIWQGSATSISTLIKDWTTVCDTTPSNDAHDSSGGFQCSYDVGTESSPRWCSVEGDYYFQWRFRDENTGSYTYSYTGASGSWVNTFSSSPNGVKIYNVNWDNDAADCECKVGSGHWDLGGDYDHPKCCGDDSNEYVITRNEYDSWTDEFSWDDDSSDKACCDESKDCVYNNECYTSSKAYDLNGDGRKEAFCYHSNDGWLNVDYHSSYCDNAGYHWNVGGGDATGDNYPASHGSTSDSNYCAYWRSHKDDFVASKYCCCGDDANEYYRYKIVSNVGDTGESTDESDDACCDASTDCVDDSTCTASGSSRWVNSNHKMACSGGSWYDCDYSSTMCGYCGGYWNLGGSGDSTDSNACCTDDNGEYRKDCVGDNEICDVSTDDVACCKASTDCVYNNVCYTNGQTVTVNGRTYKCDNGYWRGVGAICGVWIDQPKFEVKTSGGNEVVEVDKDGDAWFKCSSLSHSTPSSDLTNSFYIKVGSSYKYAFNNNNCYVPGSINQEASVPSPDGNDFAIKTSSGTYVGLFNDAGNIYVKGYAAYPNSQAACPSGYHCDSSTWKCVRN